MATPLPRRHERTLTRCVLDLAAFVGLAPEVFRVWVKQHPSKANVRAGEYVHKLLREHEASKSTEHLLSLHISAWKSVGVEVPPAVKETLKSLSREKWLPERTAS